MKTTAKIRVLMSIAWVIATVSVVCAQQAPQSGPAQPQQPLPPAAVPQEQALANQKLAEMNAKMLAAFNRIAAEYGNPTVIRVFTNDPEKGEELKQRLALLHDVEKLRSERDSLAKAVNDLKADKALRVQEIASLDDRINKHRVALAAFVRLADEAEKAFAAIGQDNKGGAVPQPSSSATVNGPSAVASSASNAANNGAMSIDPTAYDVH